MRDLALPIRLMPMGVEVGVRTGYAFSAGHLGAPPNGTDQNLGNYVSGLVILTPRR